MTLHRCDVCNQDHPEDTPLVRVQARINLMALTKDDPNHVLVELDVCGKAECRLRGLRQLTEKVLLLAMKKAGLLGVQAA